MVLHNCLIGDGILFPHGTRVLLPSSLAFFQVSSPARGGLFLIVPSMRFGRGTSSPPQFGHTYSNCCAHEPQNVHSNEQIYAPLLPSTAS